MRKKSTTDIAKNSINTKNFYYNTHKKPPMNMSNIKERQNKKKRNGLPSYLFNKIQRKYQMFSRNTIYIKAPYFSCTRIHVYT